jgi:hypothetical protein
MDYAQIFEVGEILLPFLKSRTPPLPEFQLILLMSSSRLLTKQVGLEVIFLIFIEEKINSNLSQNISYPDRIFVCVYSLLPGKCQASALIRPQLLLSNSSVFLPSGGIVSRY